MAAAETTIMTAATGAAAAGAAAGWPPSIVITAAVFGGLASVWLTHPDGIELTLRWVASAIAQIVISSAAGVALSAVAIAVLPGYSMLAPLAAAPQWALAGVIAAVIFRVAPLAWRWASRRADRADAGDKRNA